MELQQLKTALLEDFQGIKEDEEFAKMKSILWKKEAKEREDFDAVQSGSKYLKSISWTLTHFLNNHHDA